MLPGSSTRCVVLIAHFGRLGPELDLWADSAARLAADFVLIGDADPQLSLPANVRVLPMTQPQLEARVSDALGLRYRLTRPYKLCDLRPAYAHVFPELVQGYGYWGHCDTDLVFGDVPAFLPPDAAAYDKVLPFGNLSFYRNDEAVNAAYRLPWDGPDWRHVLTSDTAFHFDEERGINRVLTEHGFRLHDTQVNADIDHGHGRMRLYLERNPPRQAFYRRDGRTYRVWRDPAGQLRHDEYAYVHFQRRAMPRRDFPGVDAPHGYWIAPDGFLAMRPGEVAVEDLRRYNPALPLFLPRLKARRGWARLRHAVEMRARHDGERAAPLRSAEDADRERSR